MVYRIAHGGDFPKYVTSLHSCLFEYLDLSETEVFIHRVRESSMKVIAEYGVNVSNA